MLRMITDKNEVVEGCVISEQQWARREEIRGHAHTILCRGAGHYRNTYDSWPPACEKVANFMVMNYEIKLSQDPVAAQMSQEIIDAASLRAVEPSV